ncbi:sugar transferase [Spirosoma flavum]|uniref:Sugar transferase n=1 Tax=Spirosoma flavum TaxID=2048557 RepID=A0ABW6AFL2_9BACT
MLTSINRDTFLLQSEQEAYFTQQKANCIRKRFFDLLIAGLVTIFILIWLIPLFGLLIKLTSPGPIMFVQLRTGRNGRPFYCLKLRTMTYDRDAAFKQVVHNDSRVTRIGKFLRRTNLDEMPQFLNVLHGTMSVVGPRPHAIQHDEEFFSLIPDYYKRYAVLPGITGLAQVRGARGITDHHIKMQHRIRYDLFYINKYTLRQDMRICWWTVKSTLKGDKNAW